MRGGSSEQVRSVAFEKYVKPALREGRTRFSIAVKDVMQDLVSKGFPPANTPQVCSALRKKEFLQNHGIEIEGIDGPPSKMSTTVVFRYRLANQRGGRNREPFVSAASELRLEEDPDVWAERVTGKIRGLLKQEIAQLGGAEAFIRWVRSEDEDAA